MKKYLILFSILLVTLAIFAGCTSDEPSKEVTTEVTSEMTTVADEALPVFTLEELAKYDGQNGNPVYVGYEGKVYDVSSVEEWKNGTHRGRIKAGQDLTDVLNNEAPHSSQRLKDNAPIVGILE
jgi:predicted heme/steroid binding protein